MSDPTNGGLGAPISQQIDFDTAPFLKQRIPVLDRAMTKDQAAAYQSGSISAPVQSREEVGGYDQPLPPAPPAPQLPPAQHAIQIPVPSAAAPTRDVYPDRVNDRIGKIWGQKREAEERAAALEQQLINTTQRLEQFMAGARPTPPTGEPVPYTNQYNSYTPTQAPSSAPPAGDYVSRAEMQALFAQQQQVAFAQRQLADSQNAARVEAERDFPEVFSSPDLNARAAQIWSADRLLQSDPHGPWKVAAMVRGMSGWGAPAAAPGALADMRKTALSGVGVSVPEGSGGPSQGSEYYQALARAKATDHSGDWARVLSLANRSV